MSHQDDKKRYFKKVYDNAPKIQCECGCGTWIKSKDKYGRDAKFVNGHNRKKYDDPRQHKREWNNRNKEHRQAYKVIYGNRRKVELIRLKGAICRDCLLKYDGTNGAIFDFHHINPDEKLFALNQQQLISKSWKKIIDELEKCELLCSNCHRKIHFGGW